MPGKVQAELAQLIFGAQGAYDCVAQFDRTCAASNFREGAVGKFRHSRMQINPLAIVGVGRERPSGFMQAGWIDMEVEIAEGTQAQFGIAPGDGPTFAQDRGFAALA